jgi:hypothetical protein
VLLVVLLVVSVLPNVRSTASLISMYSLRRPCWIVSSFLVSSCTVHCTANSACSLFVMPTSSLIPVRQLMALLFACVYPIERITVARMVYGIQRPDSLVYILQVPAFFSVQFTSSSVACGQLTASWLTLQQPTASTLICGQSTASQLTCYSLLHLPSLLGTGSPRYSLLHPGPIDTTYIINLIQLTA